MAHKKKFCLGGVTEIEIIDGPEKVYSLQCLIDKGTGDFIFLIKFFKDREEDLHALVSDVVRDIDNPNNYLFSVISEQITERLRGSYDVELKRGTLIVDHDKA